MKPRTPVAGLLFLLAVGIVGSVVGADGPAPLVFHVAPEGNDRHPGTEKQPFATVGRARDVIRALRSDAKTPVRPVTVRIRGGRYLLPSPLTFTPADSGKADAPITYAADGKERPILSGGKRITGWRETTVGSRPLWVADLPEVRAGKAYYRQLWVDGQRRVRARHPNTGLLRIASLPPARVLKPRPEGNDRFGFTAGDLRVWNNLGDVEVVALHLWVGVRLPVATIDEKDRQVTFTTRSLRRLVDGNVNARYYVENALELLDTPGEWYLDRKTGKLHYWPMPGEKPDRVEAFVATLPQLVRFEGKPESKQFVEHLHLRGLGFAHAEWSLPSGKAGDIQAAADVPAVLHGDGVRHCRIEDCTIAHVSGYGLHFARGCQHNRIIGCHLHDLGAGGIKVGEMMRRDDVHQQTHGQILTDNHVHDVGRIFHQAIGIWIGQSHTNRIAHNHVHDLYYTGISLGWTWGYGPTLARGNVVEFNHVHDLGKGLLSDMAGVYTLGTQPGTIIRNNVFHDISAHRYGGWGIYFDEGSTGIVAEDNLVHRTTHGGFHQHYGKENVVRNNIFALGRDAQLQRTRVEDHRSFTLERNIVYGTSNQFLAGRWEGQVELDRNLYWRPGGAIRFAKWDWEQWRKQGKDGESLVADPLFLAPEKGDFRLRPGSPVEKIGFKMPDFSTVGVRPGGRR